MSHDESPARTMGNRPPFYKRQYIVDKPFQYRLIGTLLAIWFANSLFFTLVLYFLYDGHLLQFYNLVPRDGVLPLLTLPALFGVSIAFICVFGVIVLGIIALYMSNQIAGPLYRTKKSLDRVGQGDWAFKLQFRHGDFLKDFPGVFNEMLTGLRNQTLAEVDELKALETAAADSPEIVERLRTLRLKKEQQLGITHETPSDAPSEGEAVSVAVH